jgi:hypothetical protein
VPLLCNVNSGAVSFSRGQGLTSAFMGTGDRKAKISAINKEEAAKLRALWESRSHPSQAEFGQAYDIGNQSAVGQFLRGETPLSLNAARGFARGLGCQIGDFSPRLAAMQESWPFARLSITRFQALSPADRAYVEGKLTSAIEECELKPTKEEEQRFSKLGNRGTNKSSSGNKVA